MSIRGNPRRHHRPWRPPPAVELSPPPPLGDLIGTISIDELRSYDRIDLEHVKIQDAQLIGSFNWVDGKAPTISIPGQYGPLKQRHLLTEIGKPPLWTPLEKASQLREDSGRYFRDRNAASFPDHPLEPAIATVLQMNPEHIPVDIFACCSTLGNLLRYIQGDDRGFRILVEMVGDTAHFVRRENSPKELIPDVRGYGHTFPDAYTTWESDVKGSWSSQRILKYRFGEFDLMVRFESDGYIPSDDIQQPPPAMSKSSADGIGNSLESATASVEGRPTPSNKGILRITKGGEMVPQSAVFDLKTRSIKSRDKDVVGEQLPRLWMSQITQLVLAYHTRGKFEDIEVKDVKDHVEAWEDLNQLSLKRLNTLLRLILQKAREAKDGKLEVVRPVGDTLEIRDQLPDAGNVLSASTRARWKTWLQEPARSVSAKEGEPEYEDGSDDPDSDLDSDSESTKDYTLCKVECGYCGKCAY